MPNFTIDLGGAWKLQRVGSAQHFPATVPGCVHTDLLKAGAIEDPFYRDNELKVKWVSEADWIYSRSFSVGDEVLARDRVLLRCKGLDTFAVVTVNGREVGAADNMYRLWEFDIKPALRRGENRISIRFNSVLPYIRRRQKERNLAGWGGPREVAGRALGPQGTLQLRLGLGPGARDGGHLARHQHRSVRRCADRRPARHPGPFAFRRGDFARSRRSGTRAPFSGGDACPSHGPLPG